jgi:hypothetical protein
MVTVSSNKDGNTGIRYDCGCSSTPIVKSERGIGTLSDDTIYSEAREYCLKKYKSGSDYEIGRCQTWYTANKNANNNFPGSYWNPVRWTGLVLYGNYELNDVYEVIKTYTAAAEQGTIPEYGHPNDTSGRDSEKVISKLKQLRPSYEENFIRVVMYELLNGVNNNITAPQLLYPRSLNAKNLNSASPKIKTMLEDYTNTIRREEADKNKPDFLDNVQTFLKYTAYAVLGGVVVYAGFKVYNAVKP